MSSKHWHLGAPAMAAWILASCGESPNNVRLVQFEAMSACANRAFAELGVKDTDHDVVEGKIGSIEPDFRLVSTGQFVAKLARFVLKSTGRHVDVTCTGDFNRRTITSLQIDVTIRRPARAEDWTFQ